MQHLRGHSPSPIRIEIRDSQYKAGEGIVTSEW